MSYSNFISLLTGKRPVWLYEITVDGVTSYLKRGKIGGDYTLGGQVYTATNVSRSRNIVTQQARKAEMAVVFPRSNLLAQQIRDSDGVIATLKLRKGFEDDPDQEFPTFFEGRVVGTKPLLTTIALQCENVFTAFRRRGIAAVMQRPCRHAHYHGGCGLDIANFNVAANATAYTDPTLTVTEAALEADGHYNGGIVTFGAFRQMVIKHVGTSLVLLAPVEGLEAEITNSGSASVSIAPGCNRSTSDCISKFDNILNYGGFPYMTDTPFDGRIVF